MQTILITGGTGLIGKALTGLLISRQYKVIILTREPSRYKNKKVEGVSYASWDVEKGEMDKQALSSADHIVHLAGAGVADKRWSTSRKREIVDSRVKSGELICRVLRETPNKVQSVISASAIGWYGKDPSIPNEFPFNETDPSSNDFLGDTARQWESSVLPVEDMGKRLVILRTGIVLSANGGAMAEFIKPIRLGIAAILGSGEQMISWIHINDMVRMYADVIEKRDYKGVYNAVAPHPVSNKELTLLLARKMKGNAFVPIHVPVFMLKLILGEMSIEVLKSTTVSASKISKAGFQFAYPDINAAINSLI
ncbi:TIGR01777 family oxidoreductase [Flavihumibacter sp. ZG627]|uniref:TIGR01777 family oxidoreductase n=1 Tax=Flavihumibacter sp. ZG627 TaxID=1463156 RepID=UPI00057FFEF6|nr:TIGR01777 family oxidoreductase [Flavihumibacter sp. ZG627]KIC92537.1 hypothetical protein HY58_03130 [Flavihumibacter sp. ZG627]